MNYKDESGRSLLEIMMVLIVMGVITLGGMYFYKRAIAKTALNTLVNDILSMDSQYQANMREEPAVPVPPDSISYDLVLNNKGWVLAYKISGNKFNKRLCEDLKAFVGDEGWLKKQYAFYPVGKECVDGSNVFCLVPKGKCEDTAGQYKIMRGGGCEVLSADDLALLNNCI